MSTPLLENILNQANALRSVSAYYSGEGRAALEQAGNLLRSRQQVILSGMGASYFACLPFRYFFKGVQGSPATCVETAELLYFGGSSFQRDAAAVLVSRSGESVEVTKLLGQIRDSGAATVGIANVPGSTLNTAADHSLLLNSPPDQLVAIQTYTATVAVLALLHATEAGELDEARAELEDTIRIVEAVVPQWVRLRDEWYAFLHGQAPLYVLGRGPGLGAVAEGVLLMHEVAKAAAIGMSIPQFRHGPVEIVDASFRAVVIGTQAVTEDLDAALANDIGRMGGQVRWLGPSGSSVDCEALCPWPLGVPKRFQPILEAIPFQILAYAQAELRGIRPGDFRWAPAVTSSEAGFPAFV